MDKLHSFGVTKSSPSSTEAHVFPFFPPLIDRPEFLPPSLHSSALKGQILFRGHFKKTASAEKSNYFTVVRSLQRSILIGFTGSLRSAT